MLNTHGLSIAPLKARKSVGLSQHCFWNLLSQNSSGFSRRVGAQGGVFLLSADLKKNGTDLLRRHPVLCRPMWVVR